jgi:hypothetical protein
MFSSFIMLLIDEFSSEIPKLYLRWNSFGWLAILASPSDEYYKDIEAKKYSKMKAVYDYNSFYYPSTKIIGSRSLRNTQD